MAREEAKVSIDSYPLVSCPVHQGELRVGYSVCRHIAAGAEIALHYTPTGSALGHLACAACTEDVYSGVPNRVTRAAMVMEVHCLLCVEYHLGDRLPAAEVDMVGALVQ